MKTFRVWTVGTAPDEYLREDVQADFVSFEGGVAAFYRSFPEQFWRGVSTVPSELIRAWAPGAWAEVEPAEPAPFDWTPPC